MKNGKAERPGLPAMPQGAPIPQGMQQRVSAPPRASGPFQNLNDAKINFFRNAFKQASGRDLPEGEVVVPSAKRGDGEQPRPTQEMLINAMRGARKY